MQQKVIGLIGGMSWESSAEYYRIINETVRARLGGLRSARCLMWSFDFGEIEALQHAGRWDAATAALIDAARRLERGGADVVVICTNTMHRMADAVQAAIGLPLLHIADPTAERIRAAGFSRVGLLGTAFTMEQDFYKGRLAARHGLDVLVPEAEDRAEVHRVIYEELVRGRALPASREAYRAVIARLVARGAQGIILGCTEIMLLVRPRIARCHCSTRRRSMPRRRSIGRWRAARAPHDRVAPWFTTGSRTSIGQAFPIGTSS